MATTTTELVKGETVNCCNGRVGRQMAELIKEDKAVREIFAPTGVEMIARASAAGLLARETVNCCNGRVGRTAMEEVAQELGG